MRLIYLGSPYSHKQTSIMHLRVSVTAHCMAHFRRSASELVLYSPIVQWSRVAFENDLPHDFETWKQHDFFMIRKSSALWVLTIDGWRESYGVQQEMEFAKDINTPIMYVVPEWDEAFSDITGYFLTSDEPN